MGAQRDSYDLLFRKLEETDHYDDLGIGGRVLN
jgi:hypothetical protein